MIVEARRSVSDLKTAMRSVLGLTGLFLVFAGVIGPLTRQVALSDHVEKIGPATLAPVITPHQFVLAVPPLFGFAAILMGLTILVALLVRR